MKKKANTQLVVQAEAVQESGNLLSVIAKAVANPDLDVEKLSRLLDVHERIVAEQRKTAFMAAMARLTPKLPEIGKHGMSHHGPYSRLEDIDRAIRPIIASEGFAMSFDSQEIGNKIRVICKLSHAEGHFETKQIDLPIDNSGSKNGAQAVISTVSYGRRVLTKMFFNLIEAGEDLDGNRPIPITEDQVKDLQILLQDTDSNVAKFLAYMNVEKLEDITSAEFKRAINALETKQRVKQK
jgi:ERF superfamily